VSTPEKVQYQISTMHMTLDVALLLLSWSYMWHMERQVNIVAMMMRTWFACVQRLMDSVLVGKGLFINQNAYMEFHLRLYYPSIALLFHSSVLFTYVNVVLHVCMWLSREAFH
jgi:hypothetical protein